MRKIIAMGLVALSFTACNNDNETTETTYTDTVITTEPAVAVHTPSDGDVTYYSGKVQVYRNDAWVEADDEVKFDNGVIIYRDGRAIRDGNEVYLEDGYIVDRDGNVFDRTGNAIGDAWDATKHGVKKAGQAVGDAAKKVGDEVKDATN